MNSKMFVEQTLDLFCFAILIIRMQSVWDGIRVAEGGGGQKGRYCKGVKFVGILSVSNLMLILYTLIFNTAF